VNPTGFVKKERKKKRERKGGKKKGTRFPKIYVLPLTTLNRQEGKRGKGKGEGRKKKQPN